jgi:DNA invertase Pin-like site-specific DNA recombinase
MVYGYARVSTQPQELEVQKTALKAAGCEYIFTDKVTGTSMERPDFKRMMKTVRAGDTVVVHKLDRLARTLSAILATVEQLDRNGVEFRSLNPPIDRSNAMGRAFYQLLGVFAELERELILERTADGRHVAKAKGVKFGRKPSIDQAQLRSAQSMLATGKHTVADVAHMLKVNRTTLWRHLKRSGLVAA